MASYFSEDQIKKRIFEDNTNLNFGDSPIQASADQVLFAAKELVDYSEKLQKLWEQDIQLIQKTSSTSITRVTTFNKKMVQTKEQFIELMDKVFKLQNIVNNFIGQQVQMIYTAIEPSGQVKLYKFENSIDHLVVDKESGTHNFSGRIKFSKRALNGMEEFKLLNYDPQTSGLQETFQETYARAQKSKARAKQIKKAMGGAFYIFWKEGSEWSKAYITSMGVLGESYFKFYLNEYIFQSFMEAAVGEFITHPEFGALAGDNASGFLQGDYSKLYSYGSVEFGIKAEKASSMGYLEIIEYAKQMLAAPDLETYLLGEDKTGFNRGLKARLAKEAGQSLGKKMTIDLNNDIDKYLMDEIEKSIKPLKNIIIK